MKTLTPLINELIYICGSNNVSIKDGRIIITPTYRDYSTCRFLMMHNNLEKNIEKDRVIERGQLMLTVNVEEILIRDALEEALSA